MNFVLRQLGLALVSRLFSQEVVSRLVASLVLIIQSRVQASATKVDDKVLEAIDKIITQEELVDFIVTFFKTNVK